jgi:hypothetical protein
MTHAPPLKFIPPSRLAASFPWPIWALGWLALIKALLWIFVTDTHNPPLLGKYLLMAVPCLLLCVGIWNLRKWALWGLGLVCLLDLASHFILPNALIITDPAPGGIRLVLYSTVINFISGPISDAASLALLPIARHSIGKWTLLENQPKE